MQYKEKKEKICWGFEYFLILVHNTKGGFSKSAFKP